MNDELLLSSIPVSSAELLAEDPIDEQVLVAAVNTKLKSEQYINYLKNDGKVIFHCSIIHSEHQLKILSKYFNEYNGWRVFMQTARCNDGCSKDHVIRNHITFMPINVVKKKLKEESWWGKLWK